MTLMTQRWRWWRSDDADDAALTLMTQRWRWWRSADADDAAMTLMLFAEHLLCCPGARTTVRLTTTTSAIKLGLVREVTFSADFWCSGYVRRSFWICPSVVLDLSVSRSGSVRQSFWICRHSTMYDCLSFGRTPMTSAREMRHPAFCWQFILDASWCCVVKLPDSNSLLASDAVLYRHSYRLIRSVPGRRRKWRTSGVLGMQISRAMSSWPCQRLVLTSLASTAALTLQRVIDQVKSTWSPCPGHRNTPTLFFKAPALRHCSGSDANNPDARDPITIWNRVGTRWPDFSAAIPMCLWLPAVGQLLFNSATERHSHSLLW